MSSWIISHSFLRVLLNPCNLPSSSNLWEYLITIGSCTLKKFHHLCMFSFPNQCPIQKVWALILTLPLTFTPCAIFTFFFFYLVWLTHWLTMYMNRTRDDSSYVMSKNLGLLTVKIFTHLRWYKITIAYSLWDYMYLFICIYYVNIINSCLHLCI